MIKRIKLHIPFLFFLSTLIATFSFGNIFFLSTQSPDFIRYRNYLDYFILTNENLALEQGLMYFLIISLFVRLRINEYGNLIQNEITNIGEQTNFSYYSLSRIEQSYNLGIQEGNFVLYLIGLIGLYNFFKYLNFNKNTIFYSLSILNCFPVLFELRLTLKPEIFAFALLPWVLFFIEIYKKRKDFLSLTASILFFSILVSSKASIALMAALFIFVNYYKFIFSIKKRILFATAILFTVFTSMLMYENYKVTSMNLLTRADINLEYGQIEYDNKANVSFLYNLNFSELLRKPTRDSHANSFLGITLLDTFDDYFNLYWNKDYILMNIDRKEFIQSGNNGFYFDSINDVLFLPSYLKFNLNYFRKYIGIFLTTLLYALIFYLLKKEKKFKKLLTGPFIGMFVLLLSSFGIPENNFDPNVGDTVKVFYYGFLISISLSYLLVTIFEKNSKFVKFYILIFTVIFFFITGFPKANNTYLDYSIAKTNSQTVLCPVNNIFLNNMLLEKEGLNCEDQSKEEFCKYIDKVVDDKNKNVFEKNNTFYKFTDLENCKEKLSTDFTVTKFNNYGTYILPTNIVFLIFVFLILLRYIFFANLKNKY